MLNFYKSDVESAVQFRDGYHAARDGYHCMSNDNDFIRGHRAGLKKDRRELAMAEAIIRQRDEELSSPKTMISLT